jgi:hypothetical protein
LKIERAIEFIPRGHRISLKAKISDRASDQSTLENFMLEAKEKKKLSPFNRKFNQPSHSRQPVIKWL